MARTRIAEILDREFDDLTYGRRTPSSPLPASGVRKKGDQAAYLGVSPEHYSRIRNGRSPLTTERALGWAGLLRDTSAGRVALAAELMGKELGTPPSPASAANDDELVASVRRYFDEIEDGSKALLIVIYQGPPRAGRTNRKYAVTATFAGQAVARGLRFAMVQPFGDEEIPGVDRMDPRNYYFYRIQTMIREVRDRIRIEAVKAFQQTHPDATAAQLDEVRNRVVLFERRRPYPKTTAVQDRIFYRRRADEEGGLTELHEWVTGPEKDWFFPRSDDPDDTEVGVFEAMYRPLISAWLPEGDLPHTHADFEAYDDDGLWTIWEGP